MVIESYFWREDLIRYAKAFRPVNKPPRWSERLVVNFEKDVTMALFIVRRLAEAGKFSSKFKNHKVNLFRCQFNGKPHRLIYKDIEELYELKNEEQVTRGAIFICNQFIHADFTYAIRGEDRNWNGLYTTSDFERKKWIYRIPLSEIIKIITLASEDYPTSIQYRYDRKKEEWMKSTN